MGDEAQVIAVPAEDGSVERFAEPGRALGNGVEHGLYIRRRTRDHAEDFARCRLLLERLRLALQRLRLEFQRFRQALLEVADPSVFVLWRLGGDRELGFGLQ